MRKYSIILFQFHCFSDIWIYFCAVFMEFVITMLYIKLATLDTSTHALDFIVIFVVISVNVVIRAL